MQGKASEVQSMAAKATPGCARHVAAVRGKAAAVPSIAAEGMPSCKAAWRPRGCRGAQQGCEGPPRCAAWLPRCCRGAQHGCLGDAEVQGMAAD